MTGTGTVRSERGGGLVSGRVWAFVVDDGLFSLHLDWAEAVYPADTVSVHTVRSRKGGAQDFLIHSGQPAFVVDLRDLFGLRELQGATARAAYVVVRSGSYRLALQADSIEGIRELDLSSQKPVPSSMVRDGGLCVANLVEHEGGILVILDPHRLLDGAARDALDPALRNAQAFIDREEKIEQAWTVICHKPELADVRSYARLCKRNGRTKTAAAARAVLKHLEGGPDAADAGVADRILHESLRAARQHEDGEIVVQPAGADVGRVFVVRGRIVDADYCGAYGSRALRLLLSVREAECRFVAGWRAERPEQMKESTVATLIEALVAVSGEKRARRGR